MLSVLLPSFSLRAELLVHGKHLEFSVLSPHGGGCLMSKHLGAFISSVWTGPVLWGSNVLRFPGEGTRALEAISLIYNSVYQFLVLRGGNS